MKLRITKGPRQGDEIEIRAGIKIGRSGADFNLKDGKASQLHAEIRLLENRKNTYVLVDLGSTNKIRFNGGKVLEVPLEEGVEFSIGITHFVVEIPDSERASVESWRSTVQRIASETPIDPPKKNGSPLGFRHLLELHFLKGPQKGEIYSFAYGPRSVGPHSFDCPILESGAPSLCFTLSPDEGGHIIFKTLHQKTVLLNESPVSSEKLKDGDIISIFETRMKVLLK
ncbi:MAG: FHA domain-containing protein [Bdellovibrionales bacterium]